MHTDSVAVSDLAKIAQCEGMVVGDLLPQERARPVDNGAAADRGLAEHRQHDQAVRVHMIPASPGAPTELKRRGVLVWLWALLRGLLAFLGLVPR